MLLFSHCGRKARWQGGRKSETRYRKCPSVPFFKNVFILRSFTWPPRSITRKKMCGRISKEEREEMKKVFDEIGEFNFAYSDKFSLLIQPVIKTRAVIHGWICSYGCSFLLVFNILLFVQIWTEMGISVIMSSTSSWKAQAMPCLATWFGTSSRTLTAIMTTRSALMSFCR